MKCRRVVWALVAMATTLIVPIQAHAQPPTECLSNTPKGKQVYIPCDLMNARVNYPPGQRCTGPLDQYSEDVREWCG